MAAASNSFDNASQLARRSARFAASDTSQVVASPVGTVCKIRIGSFNLGMGQNWISSGGRPHYTRKVENIITTCVQDAGLHIMNLCKLGLYLDDAVKMKIFQGPTAPSVTVHYNHLAAWGFDAEATRFGVRRTGRSKTHLFGTIAYQQVLVVHSFENSAGVRIMFGNLHNRPPAGVTVSTVLKKKTS